MDTLEQILGEATPSGAEAPTEPPPEETPKGEGSEAPPEETPPEDKPPEDTPPEETPPEEPPKEEPPPGSESESGIIVAMHRERDRRQSTEKEFEAYKTAHPEQPEERPDVFEDANAAFEYSEAKVSNTVTEVLLQEGKGEAVREHGQELVDKAEAWFVSEAQDSPMMVGNLKAVPLLRQHRRVVEMYNAEQGRTELGDPDKLRATLKEEVRLELLAEQKADRDKAQKLRDSVLETLVGDDSKGGITGAMDDEPASLESIIGQGA